MKHWGWWPCWFLAAACGDLGGGSVRAPDDVADFPDAADSDELFVSLPCAVSPSAAEVGAALTVAIEGLPASSNVRLRIDQGGALSELDLTSDAGGRLVHELEATHVGPGTASAYTWKRKRRVLSARCSFTVSQGADDGGWAPLTVMPVVDPLDYGAVGDGVADDGPALAAAIAALPATGGIVYLPAGKVFRKTDVLVITKSHVKLWAPNRQATLFSAIGGVRRRSGFICRGNTGCGFFGPKLTSDATERFDAAEDNQLVAENATDFEAQGTEISGSPAAGIFVWSGSRRTYIDGNYVHHTQADHIHHTDGSRQSWVWDNWLLNDTSTGGDDGIACVTYCPTCTKCGEMEWWSNTYLGGAWGRGYSIIGGEQIEVHHNWAIGTAGAGLIVASEPSYDTSSSNALRLYDNWLLRNGHTIGHPAILVSGLNTNAPPITDVTFSRNVVVSPYHGAYRAEGAYTNVVNELMSTSSSAFPSAVPTSGDVRIRDTSVLRTRDVSFVAADSRRGLHRIHVRRAPSGSGFEQRFEYVVKGSAAELDAWVTDRSSAGDALVEKRSVDGTSYALVLSRAAHEVPPALSGVDFPALRSGDKDGRLGWLWAHVNSALP